MQGIQAIIFDLDGVIIDSEALHNAAVATAIAARGVTVPEAFFDEFMGRPDEVLLDYINRHHLAGRYTVTELLADKQAAYLQVVDQMQAIPGAIDFIQRARPHFRAFGLATSSLRSNQVIAFDRFDLHRYFDVVVTAEDVTHTKPDPEPYRSAMARLGLPAAACVVIEDSVNGVRAGKGAGCQVIGLTTTCPAAQLEAAGADVVCASFTAIQTHLLTL
ncbi:MAG TPA: HAD family phosphatase [Chloroflexi bacterium]|nr:HAD family phosphatase [Chloroflexota bacterium]